MTREQAIDAYRRTQAWSERESSRIRQLVLVKYFSGDGCCLHNWMLNYESADYHKRFGTRGITEEAYKAGRFYNWKQRQIWDTSSRLQSAFAKFF